ncbi:MAG: hypothetical protein AB7S70_17100 [Hyphomicrobium sp.]
MLATLLSVWASAAAFGVSTGVATTAAATGHGSDVRSASAPASLRADTTEAGLSFGGTDDHGFALPAPGASIATWTTSTVIVQPAAFDLPVDAARTRDGRTRAPPHA